VVFDIAAPDTGTARSACAADAALQLGSRREKPAYPPSRACVLRAGATVSLRIGALRSLLQPGVRASFISPTLYLRAHGAV